MVEQERLEGMPYDREGAESERKSGPADAVRQARQSLAFCSLLELAILTTLLVVTLKELSLSPLLYVAASLGLGAMGAVLSCCRVTV